jgi:hypothetical protein
LNEDKTNQRGRQDTNQAATNEGPCDDAAGCDPYAADAAA